MGQNKALLAGAAEAARGQARRASHRENMVRHFDGGCAMIEQWLKN